jgi:hypothetical protein
MKTMQSYNTHQPSVWAHLRVRPDNWAYDKGQTRKEQTRKGRTRRCAPTETVTQGVWIGATARVAPTETTNKQFNK